jgi:hypothetical protein
MRDHDILDDIGSVLETAVKLKIGLTTFSIVSTILLSISDVGAVTLDQAKAQCHDKFVPVVRECVRRKVSQSGGSPAQYIPGCRDSIIQSMQATAKDLGKSMDLVVYPDAEHNFVKDASYRATDADDAWKRTAAALTQYLRDTPGRRDAGMSMGVLIA